MNGLGRKLLPLFLAMRFLGGCLAPESELIIQTRVVEMEVTAAVVHEVTRVITPRPVATPFVETVTPFPLSLHLYLAPQFADAQAAADLASFLQKRAGLKVEPVLVASEREVVAALCGGKADLAFLSAPAYLVAHATCGAQARFITRRDGLPTYRAEIVVQADAVRKARGLEPISTLQDLNGKSCAYTVPVSLTGYLLPKAMLTEAGVSLKDEVFVGGETQAIYAAYSGQQDAAMGAWRPLRTDGSVGDARASLLESYPDVGQVLKVLRLSEPIPNDAIVLRKDLPQDVQGRLLAAWVDLVSQPQGRTVLGRLGGVTGLCLANDQDYDALRQAAKTLGLDFTSLLDRR